MDQSTTQFVYRAVVIIIGAVLGVCLLIVAAVVLRYGDGEAIKIADTLTPWVLSTVGSLIAFVVGHQLASARIANTSNGIKGLVDTTPATSNNHVDMPDPATENVVPTPATSGL